MKAGPSLRHARTSDGVSIAYVAMGEGPALIWMPSLGNLLAQWRVPVLRRAYELLASRSMLVLYDGRGTGSSERKIDPAGLGLDGQVADLSAVVDAVAYRPDSGPVAVLGYYHSVPAAIAYAATRPERVSHLVLFGGSLRLRDSMSPAQTQALLTLVDLDWNLFAESAAHIWTGWASGESGRLIAESFRTAVTPTVAKAIFAAAADIDVTTLAPRVRAPALVLHRQGADQMPVELSQELAGALPAGQLRVLDGSTPTLFFENPDRDMDLVLGFLAGEPAPPSPAPAGLTGRELEVLRRLAAGDSNAGVASTLGISVHTVERHVANLYRKIGARGRADATAYALRNGLGDG